MKLAVMQPSAQRRPAKSTSFGVVSVSIPIGKLDQISRPMSFPSALQVEMVSLREIKHELQLFTPTAKRIPKSVQTMSGGNEEKYSLHVSSETGAPHVSFNLSLSTASSLDLTTRKQMLVTSTASKIQHPWELEVFPPLQQGPGTLMIVIQPSAARLESLSVSVVILPSTPPPSLLPSFLPKNGNCLLISMPLQSSLVSALLALQQLMLQFIQQSVPPIMESSQLPLVNVPPQSLSSCSSAVFSTLLPEDASFRLTTLLQPSMACTLRQIFTSELMLPTMKSTHRVTQSSQLLPFVSVRPRVSPSPVTYETSLAEILPPVTYKVPSKTLQLSIVAAPSQSSPHPSEISAAVTHKVRPRNTLELSMVTELQQLSSRALLQLYNRLILKKALQLSATLTIPLQPRPQPSQPGEIPPATQTQALQSSCDATEKKLAIVTNSEDESEPMTLGQLLRGILELSATLTAIQHEQRRARRSKTDKIPPATQEQALQSSCGATKGSLAIVSSSHNSKVEQLKTYNIEDTSAFKSGKTILSGVLVLVMLKCCVLPIISAQIAIRCNL